MYRFPGCMEATFVARSNDHVNARFLAAHGPLHGWNHMHPGKSGVFNLLLPTNRVAGRGKDYLEVLSYVGIFFPNPDCCIDQDFRFIDQLSRHHDVYSEYTAFILDQTISSFYYLLQRSGHIVIPVRFTTIHKGVVNPRLRVLAEKATGGKQAQNPRIGRSHAKIIVAERSHSRLDDGIFDPDQVTKS